MPIKLFWWKEKNNLGDAASCYLFEKLTGNAVQWTSPQTTFYSEAKRVVKYLLLKRKISPLFSGYVVPWKSAFFAIGSILDFANFKTIVWGSGFREFTSKYKGGKIVAVRGKLFLDKLPLSLDKSRIALGDPALLLPLVYQPVKCRRSGVALIPHWTEYDYFLDAYGASYDVIDIRISDVEEGIDRITQSEYILSTSLHGLVIAHAYGIPALWIKKGYIHTSSFKFYDYFSAVGIPPYEGFENIGEILASSAMITDLFDSHAEKARIKESLLKEIQQNLLDSFPCTLSERINRNL